MDDALEQPSAEPSGDTDPLNDHLDPPAIAADFRQVVRQFEAPLLRYAQHLVGQRSAEAEDVVQEAFLRLHRYRDDDRARNIRHLSTWLFRVTHNLAMDALRKRARRQRGQRELQKTSHDPASPADQMLALEQQELASYAVRQMKKLPRQQREVLLLKLVQGLTARQIAKILNVSPSTVSYQLNQGLMELTHQMKKSGAV